MTNLEQIRTDKGLSRSELATLSGVSQWTIRNWETEGDGEMIDKAAAVNVLKVAKVLGCEIEDVLETVTDTPEPIFLAVDFRDGTIYTFTSPAEVKKWANVLK